MHPFKLLQLALLVTSAAAVPLDAPIQEQKVPAIYQNCIEAVNCEVYEEDGHYNIRFVEGKGINSAWYNETFKDYNETLVAEVPTNGSRVLNRGVNCQGNVCTEMAGNTNIVHFGDTIPRDIIDVMWNHCYVNGCNTLGYERAVMIAYGGNWGYPARNILRVQPSGAFPAELRWPFIFAMTEIIHQTTTSDRVNWYYEMDNVIKYGTATRYFAPEIIHVNRYIRIGNDPVLQGFISAAMHVQSHGSENCGKIVEMISGGANFINDKVGGVFGWLSILCG